MKIAIASGKGGTGKTTLAVNLSHFLAEKHNVVLADLDVEEPNSGIFISGELMKQEDKFTMKPEWLKDRCTLCGKCQEVCNFNAVLKLVKEIMVFPELCHSCYACSELCPEDALPMKPVKIGTLKHSITGKLNFVESKLDIGQEQAVPLIEQTIDYIDDNIRDPEFIIFDAPPGTSCPMIEVVRNADLTILITEPTPFGLHDLKLAVDTLHQIECDSDIVINKFGIGNNDIISYCSQKGLKIIARLENDRKIAELYSQGKLIHPYSQNFRDQLKLIVDHIRKNTKE